MATQSAGQKTEQQLQRVADARRTRAARLALNGRPVSFQPKDVDELWLLAVDLWGAKSATPRRAQNINDVMLRLLWGQANGVDMLTAFQGVDILEGRIFIAADLYHATLLRRLDPTPFEGGPRGEYVELIESTSEKATYEFMRKGWKAPKFMSYTAEQAVRAGLWASEGAWTTSPETMMCKRALSNGAREYYPDKFYRVYTDDERRDFEKAVNDAPAGILPRTSTSPVLVKSEMGRGETPALAEPRPAVRLEVAPEAQPAETASGSAPTADAAPVERSADDVDADLRGQILSAKSLQDFRNAAAAIEQRPTWRQAALWFQYAEQIDQALSTVIDATEGKAGMRLYTKAVRGLEGSAAFADAQAAFAIRYEAIQKLPAAAGVGA